MEVPTSTAQSGKNARTWSPRPGLNTASTSRMSGFSSRARSAAWKLPTSSWRSRASAWAEVICASVNAWLVSSSRSITRAPGSRSMCGPWP
jgi:hypothetical protein